MKLQKFDMLRITGCSDPQLWYSGLVGTYVPHLGFDLDSGYRSKEPAGFTNFVRLADATPITTIVGSDRAGRWPYLHGHSVWELTKLAKHGMPMDVTSPGLPSDRDTDHPVFTKLHEPPAPPEGPPTRKISDGSKIHDEQDRGQSRGASLAESLSNIVVGFLVSVLITAWVMPVYGHRVTVADNIQITALFTLASLARSYALRRFFNWLSLERT